MNMLINPANVDVYDNMIILMWMALWVHFNSVLIWMMVLINQWC